MAALDLDVATLKPVETGGFDFGMTARNEQIAAAAGGRPMPQPMSTGTTICGMVYDGGIAADTEKTTELIASQLELLRLSTGTQSRVVAAVTLLKRMLFKYQGHIGAALVLGGVDCTGPGLYQIYPHGSTSKLPYVTMGSGSLAAMSVFETEYKDGMDEAGAVALVKNAIRAGIFNDLGSGSNVDVTIIRAGGASEAIRGYETPNDTAPLRAAYARPKALIPPAAATAVLSTVVSVSDADAMEL
ncbi:threonine-type endopeptidase [Aureococcus anophagefferens]|uniref:Threonine-type endopeptidase n=1 Tax=Aureococcus anophagefferens TaxID=44056 RepID=A0ABR1GFM3_AURAN